MNYLKNFLHFQMAYTIFWRIYSEKQPLVCILVLLPARPDSDQLRHHSELQLVCAQAHRRAHERRSVQQDAQRQSPDLLCPLVSGVIGISIFLLSCIK